MKEFKLNEQYTIQVPQEWGDVSVSQYDRIIKTLQVSLEDKDDNLVMIANIINDLYEIPFEILYQTEMELFTEIIECFLFIGEKPKNSGKEIIEYNNKKYIIKSDFNKLTLGEAMSFHAIKNDSEITKMIGTCLREIDENENELPFNAEKMKEYMEEIAPNLKITDVYSASAFFLKG